jgi:uncharacterized membrane protein
MAAHSDRPVFPDRSLRPRRLMARGLLAVALLAIVCAYLAARVDAPTPRIAAALVLELALPGYAITVLVFARRRLDTAELALSVLGTSLVVSALGGLLLDVLPGHMSRQTWALMLMLVTLCAALAAVISSSSGSDPALARIPSDTQATEPAQDWKTGRTRIGVNLVLGVLTLALAAGALGLTLHSADRHVGFTELSALPASHGGRPRMLVRVRSHELHTIPFTIEIREDQRKPVISHITLGPGQEWRILTTPVPLTTRTVRAEVFRLGSPVAFLRTVYYLPGREDGSAAVKRRRGYPKRSPLTPLQRLGPLSRPLPSARSNL